jgi:hypothetical protein
MSRHTRATTVVSHPAKDAVQAKVLYGALLGVAPQLDEAYYAARRRTSCRLPPAAPAAPRACGSPGPLNNATLNASLSGSCTTIGALRQGSQAIQVRKGLRWHNEREDLGFY